MILKISKLLTITLLLVVNFNNSYCADNNVNIINNSIMQIQNDFSYEKNIDSIMCNLKTYNNMKSNNINSSFHQQDTIMPILLFHIQYPMYYQCNIPSCNTNNQKISSIYQNINKSVSELCTNLFANNYDYMNSVFSDWDIDLLSNLNKVLSQNVVQQCIIQERTKSINTDIKNALINRIKQLDNCHQLYNEYEKTINDMFNKYYEKLEIFKNILQDIDVFYCKNNEYAKTKTILKSTLQNIIDEEEQYIEKKYNNVIDKFGHDYYEIIHNEQVQNALREKSIFYNILNNINTNHNINANIIIQEFFDNYIGENYSKIFDMFDIDNYQERNDIIEILNNKAVKDYVTIGVIKNIIKTKIADNDRTFFLGINDPSQDKINPANKKEFNTAYSNSIRELIEKEKRKETFIEQHIIGYNDMEHPYSGSIDNMFIEFANIRMSYLDQKLQEIINDNNLNSIYQKYINFYNYNNVLHQISHNILNNNLSDVIIKKNIEQFFNYFIGDYYNEISKLFYTTNNHDTLNCINVILQNNYVKEYLAIGAIKGKLDIDLDKNRFFKGGIDDQGGNGNPASKQIFKNYYLKYIKFFINKRKDNIESIKNNIDAINANNNIKQDIKNILNQCINNREQYLNKRLEEIVDNVDNTYKEYLASYNNK